MLCYMLYAICYLLYAICYLLFAICYLLFAMLLTAKMLVGNTPLKIVCWGGGLFFLPRQNFSAKNKKKKILSGPQHTTN